MSAPPLPGLTWLDPRSYHLFSVSGTYYLFDRATGTTAAVSEDFATALTRGCSSDAATGSAFESLLQILRGQGFFHYEPVDHAKQEEQLEGLWQHKPRRIQLLMAQGCNLGCRYCYAWRNGSNQKGTLMAFDVAKQAVDFLIERSGSRSDLQVTFFGGEPLLNLETIRDVVTYCRGLELTGSKCFTFEIITNGVLLTPEVTDWMVQEKFLLMISLDGWKEMHRYNRPSLTKSDDHEVIVRHAQYANEQYMVHGLGAVKIRANLTDKFHDTQSVFDYLRSLGFSNIGMSVIEPLPHGDNSPSALTEDQLDELTEVNRQKMILALEQIERGEDPGEYAVREIRKRISAPETRRTKGITCGVNRNTAVVDNKGAVYPCHRYEGMPSYVVGNVFTGMDREATMGYYRKVNRNATNRCHSCWLRDYCAGGCAWLLSAKDGTIHDPTERECDRRRAGMEFALYMRQRLRQVKPGWFQKEENDLLSQLNLFGDVSPEDALSDGSSSCGSGCGDCGSGCGS